MKSKEKIKDEIERFESYIKNEKEYCEEPNDKPFYKGVIKSLKWVLNYNDVVL